jgi:glucosamine--fructose-6-phosphate aminotransferase (isomerizing)
MCGIVGAISNQNIVPNLIEGLSRLEYRGYDSSGIAVLRNGIERVRSVGRVAEIETMVKEKKLEGSLGIGHTRWATHGGVTELNAHPHVSLSLIHI